MIGYALTGLLRAPGRAAARIAALAAAVALLAAMLLFVGHSLGTMTRTAVRSVPLDWQGPVASAPAARHVAAAVASQPDVAAAVPAATAPFAAMEHDAPAGAVTSAAGGILAVPPGANARMATFRLLHGSLRPDGIVLDQQLAATLQAGVGDTVRIVTRRGGPRLPFRVSGVAVVTAPDVLFQPLDPLLGPTSAQPPANIAIVPFGAFASRVAPTLPRVAPATPASAAVPGAQRGVLWQVHAQVDPAELTGSPSHALQRANQVRNAVERSLPGQVRFVDNLADHLSGAAGDALYAEAMLILLAVPGALVALGLAYLAALGAADRDRRALALLRARGASRRSLLTLGAAESVALGVVAGPLGWAVGLAAAHLSVGGGFGRDRTLITLGVCIALAIAGAAVARAATTLGVLRASIVEGRRSVRREGRPTWQRLYLDVACLVVSGLVYWLTARTGFSAVVNPDSNPTLSLSVYMFLAPALLWLGSALLLARLRGRVLVVLARRAAGGLAGSRTGLLLASASRRGPALNRGLVLAALLLAFGVELGLFSATWNQQALVDAELTVGADVVATAPPGVVARDRLTQRLAGLPGATAASAVDHAYAYVGPDLQDTFGVDPATIGRATTLRDSYFLGGSAADQLARLRSRPDAILVSRETVTDYSLNRGDLLRLRVLDRRTGKFRVAPFHVVGIVQEFPSAPRDSFMVTNLAYLQRVTHDPGPNVVFVRAGGDPGTLAARVASATRRNGVVVKDIRHQVVQTASAITTVDLSGISRIEEVFAIALAAVALALYVLVALAERRHELATMAAVGATVRDAAAYLWSEVAIVAATAVALAALLGWLLAEMLVAMLRHAFDPPPDHLAAPWPFLAALGGGAVAAAALAAALAATRVRRLPLGAILREQ